MKKWVSVLLAAMMLLGCASALAEGAEEIVPAYQVNAKIPEGYTAEGPEWVDPYLSTMTLVPDAADKPGIMMVISYNDSFSDITFNADMAEADFTAEVEKLAVNEETGEAIPYTVEETGLGTKVVVLSHADGYTEFYTIWHGYEVSLHCANFSEENDSSALTEEQIALVMQFLTDLDLAKVIEEEPAA